MEYRRTRNFSLLDDIFRQPEIYEFSGDDTLPPEPGEFKVRRESAVWYVLAEAGDFGDIIGLFVLMPQNAICWEVHGAMMPWSSTTAKWDAARQFLPWLWSHTPCRRVTAAVPACNRRARVYVTYGMGMRYVGRHEKAFLKYGQLHDLVLFGMSAEGTLQCPA
jgi:RimJ/RimL family protein N-acetyltransferase